MPVPAVNGASVTLPVPALTVPVRFSASPVRVTNPEVVVMLFQTVRPLEPVSVTAPDDVVSVPLVASSPPLLRKSILPVLVLKLNAGNVSRPPAMAVMLVLAPNVGNANVRSFASRIDTLAPVLLSVSMPAKSFDALSAVIEPALLLASVTLLPVTVPVWICDPVVVNAEPVPIVMVPALSMDATVSLLPFRLNVAPLFTATIEASAITFDAPSASVPLLIVVAPV
ncbi:MAG: hypothetical protein NTW90_09470 [Nitrosospira sp.]|nr:hypothetical protein [Nitrosospira sp.]